MELKLDKYKFSFTTHFVEDFTDARIHLGDYIRLKGLHPGEIFCLEGPGELDRVLMVGDGSPYEGVSSVSHDRWDWNLYNTFRLLAVVRIGSSAEHLCPREVKMIRAHEEAA